MLGLFRYFFSLSRFHKRVITLTFDCVALLTSLWLAYVLRAEDLSWVPSVDQLGAAVATVLATQLVFVRLGLYRAVLRYLGDQAFTAIFKGIVASCLFLLGFSVLFSAHLPYSVPLIYGLLGFVAVSGSRAAVRGAVRGSKKLQKPLVGIIGAGETGLQLSMALKRGIEFDPAFFISFKRDNDQAIINDLPVYTLDTIDLALKKHPVKRLLLALDEDSTVNRSALIRELEPLSVPVQTVPSVAELISGRARINDIRDLDIEHLLGREPIPASNDLLAASLKGKSVLVSGAGGSIGSELCRQILRCRPKTLVLFELSEYALYSIERDLASINAIEGLGVAVYTLLGSVKQRTRCENAMKAFGTEVVYHAAAYKHVPLVEYNIIEGIQNNVFGTWHLAEAAINASVERFVLVSTDKAVRPTNVMGASKRLAEMVLQGMAARQSGTKFSMVRFGNVLGSSGSVVPLFRDQIRDGGPVTVTHPDIIRYFMTIPEACQLVLQAGSMGDHGEVYVLDMGEPVKIADLAHKIIRLMGFTARDDEHPDGDIEVVYTGLRPGEKLYEELLIGNDPQGTAHPRIMKARETCLPWEGVERLLAELDEASRSFDCDRIVALLKGADAGYQPDGHHSDLVGTKAGVK